MDLNIEITDENGETLEDFRVYQDGSDSNGASTIASMVEAVFDVSDSIGRTTPLNRAHGTDYGIMFKVEEWQQICRSLRADGENQYAAGIEKSIAGMQESKKEDEEHDLKMGRA